MNAKPTAAKFFWELEKYEGGAELVAILRKNPKALDKLLMMGFIPLAADVLACSYSDGLTLKLEFTVAQQTWTGASIVAWRVPGYEYVWQEDFDKPDFDVILSKIEKFLMQFHFSGLDDTA